MHRYVWIVFGIGLLFGVSACGSDGASDPRGSGGNSGGIATVTGVVTIESTEGPSIVSGATVGELGTTSTTTSDMNGAFSLDVPVGTVMFETTAPPAWGEILADEVPAAGLDDLDPELLAEDLIEQVDEALGTVDDSKGVVVVEFPGNTAAGGETARLGVAYGFAFVFNANEEPVLGNTLIAGGDTVVVFANVEVGSNVMPTATGCSLDFPSAVYPSKAKTITAITVTCP